MNRDANLYKEFLKGSITAFEELVLEHKDNLIYFISRYTGGDIYAAEDIAQDIFAYIYVYKDKYNLDYSFKTFIYTLGRNKAVDYVRKQSRLSSLNLQGGFDNPASEESLEDKIIRDEEKGLLLESIGCLSLDYQRIIYLVDFEGLSYKEAGQVLGKNLGQIKVLLYRARARLKEVMGKGASENEKQ